ncbi:hypothetical protein [Altererythrobacter sp. GH1-8]|uniref:hypothetical protein n=1 Tax=Altererythrobacter sp. GH1-8 TaxID=3349333 RepID=UPI00374DBEC2
MIDWTPIIIAGFGILGTLIAPFLAHKLEGLRRREQESREDGATLRLKLEELYAELDRLEGQCNRSNISAISMASGKGVLEPLERLDLSKVRTSINLYFPECLPALRQFDDGQRKDNAEVRERIESNIEKGEDLSSTGAMLVIMQSTNFLTMAKAVRPELEKIAARIVVRHDGREG